jgi:tRNA A-37 threonylcarbamoyl transferase component Bud32
VFQPRSLARPYNGIKRARRYAKNSIAEAYAHRELDARIRRARSEIAARVFSELFKTL